MGDLKHWTEEEKQFVKDNYGTMSKSELARELGRTSGAVKSMIDKHLHIRKTPEQLRDTLKRRQNFTAFKAGHQPLNTLNDGYVSMHMDHPGRPGARTYFWIRLQKKKWKMLHVYLWELVNGPVPKGMIVVFKDKNPLNCLLSNLEMITKQENMLRNSGSMNLSDGYVANTMAWRDKHLQKVLVHDHPELIDVKRKSIELSRTIKSKQNEGKHEEKTR